MQKWRGYSYVTFNFEQIKSADPVTYDNNGNVIPLSERFNKDNNDIRYQSRNNKPDYNFSKALSHDEWVSFYSSLQKSNQRDAFRIGDNGILIPDAQASNGYKLVYYDGDVNSPRVTAVYKLENYDYNIHDGKLNIAQTIIDRKKAGLNEKLTKAILHSYSALSGTIFREYNGKTGRFIKLTRSSGKTIRNSTVESDRTGISENIGKGVSDEQINEVFQMRTDGTYSNRTLLANALETSVRNEIERNLIKAYKEGISQLDETEAKLRDVKAQIKEISFTKGSDRSQLLKLNNQKKMLTEKIARKDKQLLKLESMESMQKLIALEKDKATKRVTDKINQAVKEVREGRDKKIIAEREKRKSQIKKFRNNREN